MTEELGSIVRPLIEAIPARVGFYFEDLISAERLEFKGYERFPAASVIKVPIFLEAYRRAAAGELSLQEEVELRDGDKVGGAGVLLELHQGLRLTVEDLCRLMIVVSDNTASNLLLDRLGESSINALMVRLGMKESWLGRRFMEPPSELRDNRMSPYDGALAMRALWDESLLGPSMARGAREIFMRQQYREKIPLMLPENLPVLHKTGELDGVRHDAALVLAEGRPYLLSLFTDGGGPPWEVDLGLARISRACFDWVFKGKV